MMIEMILVMLLGFVGIMFLVSSNISQSRNETQRRKSEEIDTKIKLQPFILAAKSIYPNFKLRLFDRCAVLDVPLVNINNKKIGKIEISGLRSLTYSTNEPYYLVIVSVMIDDKNYEARKNNVQENVEIFMVLISDLLAEVMKNTDLQKRIIATTY